MSETKDHFLPVNVRSAQAILTFDTLFSEGFCQLCNIESYYGNVLDLVFVSDPSWVSSIIRSKFELSKVDINHYPFEFFIECSHFEEIEQHSEEYDYSFKRANFDELSNYFEIYDFEAIFNEQIEINEVVDKFYDILYSGFDQFVPKSIVKSNNHPP